MWAKINSYTCCFNVPDTYLIMHIMQLFLLLNPQLYLRADMSTDSKMLYLFYYLAQKHSAESKKVVCSTQLQQKSIVGVRAPLCGHYVVFR